MSDARTEHPERIGCLLDGNHFPTRTRRITNAVPLQPGEVEYVRADLVTGAASELRALFEESDYQAQRNHPTPDRFREALLRADDWLTANGWQS